ncbi:hypothetical protein LguiB_018169 [Lonicera macranthoides]
MERTGYNRGGGSSSGGDGRGRGGGGRGRGRGGRDRGGGRGGYQQSEGSDRSYGGGRGRGRGSVNPAPAQAWGIRQAQSAQNVPEVSQNVGSTRQESSRGGIGRGAWGVPLTAKASGPASQKSAQSESEVQKVTEPTLPDIQSLNVSESRPRSLQEYSKDRVLPIKRPDSGGKLSVRRTKLLVNHFLVKFNPETIIMHYDIDIKAYRPSRGWFSRPIPKFDLLLIRRELFARDPTRFPMSMTAYDGKKNIFSVVELPTGEFQVNLSDGEDLMERSYTFTIQLVNELRLAKLNEYLRAEILHIPRDILQGMDLVMKEHPSRSRICAGRSTYSKNYRQQDDLRGGIAAFRGFQQSLKPTSQGLALCLDYSVIAFRKRLPVIDFLKEHVRGFELVSDIGRLRRQVMTALVGLKVTVTHRLTKQKFTIARLTNENTRDLGFTLEDCEGNELPRNVSMVQYFREKYGREIEYPDIPCLDVGKNRRKNYIPMEFCVLVEGQRFPKEQLDKNAGILLKSISLAPARDRKNFISEALRAEDGPCGGEVICNFDIGVDQNMTSVIGRVIGAPELKLGKGNLVRVDKDKCQWNLVNKSVVDGRSVDRWALIDFTCAERAERYKRLDPNRFIPNLMGRCGKLGIRMAEPLVVHYYDMQEFNNVNKLEGVLQGVIDEAKSTVEGRLQIIICVMAGKHDGYKYLKWVSETKIGVITQCCLSEQANKCQDQYLANLGLKINAKLGGSNAELNEPLQLPRIFGQDHVMFVGADHPSPMNKSCPSIAAVVATTNWPAANRYAARVHPQQHCKEKIVYFGTMVLDLVNNYARINKVKPKRIVIFRDSVSEGQFDMVLNEELVDIRAAIYDENYRPTITLLVAQKRHQTRLFPENEGEGGPSGNVPPGTVVDTTIVHPFKFDFYLCSHYGGIGTSKPTHYYVLWDDHQFTSDQLQKLIYNMCFTFARCTKPVSLVPPVYYADLVAYRGRLFQEVVMEMQSPQLVSSSSSVASSSSGSLIDDRFYKLHPELQNIMFFV